MFNSKSKSDSTPLSTSSGTSLIGAGTIFTGNVVAPGDMRIDGTIKGNISSKAKIVIGPDGLVEGDIEGDQADIMGRVSGSVRVNDLLYLRGGSVVDGNISAKQLQVEPEAKFNGQCQMIVPATASIPSKEKTDKRIPALAIGQG